MMMVSTDTNLWKGRKLFPFSHRLSFLSSVRVTFSASTFTRWSPNSQTTPIPLTHSYKKLLYPWRRAPENLSTSAIKLSLLSARFNRVNGPTSQRHFGRLQPCDRVLSRWGVERWFHFRSLLGLVSLFCSPHSDRFMTRIAWGLRYSNNGTFTLTTTSGASATLTFNGTAVWIYGAKRSNHGPYNITLDGNDYEDDGYYNGQIFQQVLFSSVGLDATTPHTVSIINSYTDVTEPYLDIDFVSMP